MPRSVLIVDDDHVAADHYSRFLRSAGFEIDMALSGEEGLAKACQRPPHAIVLDLRMRGMDGLELLERLRANEELTHIPVVMVTGDYFLDEGTLQRVIELRVEVHYKPLWADDLVDIVVKLVDAPLGK